MAPPRWADAEQTTFLVSHQSQYLKNQADNKLPRFWAQLFEEWFDRWPERDRLFPHEPGQPNRELNSGELLVLRKALIDRKAQLKNWYPWHTKDHPSRRRPSSAWYSVRKAQEKRGRRLQHVELYQQLYYDTKIKPRVEEECMGKGMSRGQRLKTMKDISKIVYEGETDEVKAEVSQRLQDIIDAATRAADAEEEDREVDAESKRTPAQYQNAINDLVPVLTDFLTDASTRTGWHFSVLFGGPSPISGGKVQVGSLHIGKTQANNTFDQAFADYLPSIMAPYAKFCKSSFTTAQCEARTLNTEDKADKEKPDNGSGVSRSTTPLSMPELTDLVTDDELDIVPEPTTEPVTPSSSLNRHIGKAPGTASSGPPAPSPDGPASSTPTTSAADLSVSSSRNGKRNGRVTSPSTPPTSPPPSSTPSPDGVSQCTGDSDVTVEDDAPLWVHDALDHMKEKELGIDWIKCLRAWLKVEKTVGYGRGERKRLPTNGRPEEMTHWQKRGRKYTSPPIITAVLKFEDAFEEWWRGIRKSVGEDGGVLRYSGVNGILSILLLLCWWGRAVVSQANSQTRQWKSWRQCVVEVQQAFDKIPAKPFKRPLTVEDEVSRPAKRTRG